LHVAFAVALEHSGLPALEQHLNIKISDDDAHCIRHPEFSRGMVVADFVRDVFKAVSTEMAE
jgi:hypothetical protein